MKKLTSIFLALFLLAVSFTSCMPQISVSRGDTLADTYTNESLDIIFTKPSDWRFYTEDEIAATMNVTKDIIADSNILESMDITSLIEFMAVDAMSGNNVNMSIENLRASGNSNISIEKFAELTKNNFKAQLSNMNYTFDEDAKATLGDQEYLKLTAHCSYSGIEMTQFIYLRKIGAYMVSITATSVNGASSETFENMFS